MHTARKLSRISDGVYDKDYDKGYSKLSSSDKYSKHSYSRNDISPDSRSTSPKERMYGKSSSSVYNSHNRLGDPRMRRDSDRDTGRDYKYSRKENREDRERERSPRDRKWNDYKEKSREKESDGGRMTTCGDWTEHYSSTGKKYYYNCKTEVSQWEKPKDWTDVEKSRSAAGQVAKLHCDRNSRSSQDKHSSDHRASPLTSSSNRESNSRARDNNRSRRERDNHSNNHSEGVARDRGDTEISSSNDATPTSEADEREQQLSGHQQQQHSGHHQQQQHTGHQQGVVSLSAALPRLTSQPTPGLSTAQPGPGPGGSSLPALRLSGAPSSSIHTVTSSQVSPTSPPTPTQEEGPRLPSPAPSSLSSLSAVSPLTALRAAPVSLTPTLGRLYREQLIGHVLGWPAEHLEKASNKVNEDHHNISSHAITKVSAELKMARSLVRLAEIQATLQEQRILFLRQQSTDLEGIGRAHHATSRDVRDQASRERDHLSASRDRLHDLEPREHLLRDQGAGGSGLSRNHVNNTTSSHGGSGAYLSRAMSRDRLESREATWPGGRDLHK